MEWVVLVALIVLLLASVGPRAGYYGTASPILDILGLVLVIIVVVWLLRMLGVLVF